MIQILIGLFILVYIITVKDISVEYFTAPVFPDNFEMNDRRTEKSEFMGIQYLLKNGENVKISILFGNAFYSNGIDTYEIWDYQYHEDPQGRWTKLEINAHLYKHYKQPKSFNHEKANNHSIAN